MVLQAVSFMYDIICASCLHFKLLYTALYSAFYHLSSFCLNLNFLPSTDMDWSAIVPALTYLGLAGSCAVYFLQVNLDLGESYANYYPNFPGFILSLWFIEPICAHVSSISPGCILCHFGLVFRAGTRGRRAANRVR